MDSTQLRASSDEEEEEEGSFSDFILGSILRSMTTAVLIAHTAEPSTSSTHSCQEPSETGMTCPRKSLRPRPSTHLYQQYSFLPRTIRDWNDLPQEVIEAKTINTFVPAVLIPAKNHQRLEWPTPGSHWGQDHQHICTSSTHSCQEPSETGMTYPRKSLRPRPSTHLYQQYSFLPRTIRDWNDLPQEVTEAKTINTFVPAVLIPAKNHQRLEWPAPGSHWGQDHQHICTSSTHSCQEPSETGMTCPRKSLRPRPSTHLYQQYSFLPRTIRDWNDLPQEVIEAKTINTFVPAVLIPAKNHQRLEWPAPGSHWGQDHQRICVKSLQTAGINKNKIIIPPAADPP